MDSEMMICDSASSLLDSPNKKRRRVESDLAEDDSATGELLTSHVLGRVQQLLSYGERFRLRQTSRNFALVMDNFGWANVRVLRLQQDRLEHDLFHVNNDDLRCTAQRLRALCTALMDKAIIKKIAINASESASDLLSPLVNSILAHDNIDRVEHVSFSRAFDFVPTVLHALCNTLKRVNLAEFSLSVWKALSLCENIARIKSTAPATRMGYDVQEVSFSTAVTSALSGKCLTVLELVDLRLTTGDLTELLKSLIKPLHSLSIQIRNPEAVAIGEIARCNPTLFRRLKRLSVRSFDLDDGPLVPFDDCASSAGIGWFENVSQLFPALVELTLIGAGFGLTTNDLIALSRIVLDARRPRRLTMLLTVAQVEDSECERTVTDNDVDFADDLTAAFPDVAVTPMDPRVREQMELARLSDDFGVRVSLDGRRLQRVTRVCGRGHELVFALCGDEKDGNKSRGSDGVYGWHDNEWSDSDDEDEDADAADRRLFSEWPMC
uniref:F-box domain-containing protein n=1 Tax=Plectus sambesii TaxID=2011161 RepID=A0A914WE97_9BILA